MSSTSTEVRTLLAVDRCDRCGAQAQVVVPVPAQNGEVLLCMHHATKHADALAARGISLPVV